MNIKKALMDLNETKELPDDLEEIIVDTYSNGVQRRDCRIPLSSGLTVEKITIKKGRQTDTVGLNHEVIGVIEINGIEFNFNIKITDGPSFVEEFYAEYEEIEAIQDEKHKCICTLKTVMDYGCKCGGV